jgi:glutamyl-tRNA reductase
MNNGAGEIPLVVVGCDFRVASSSWRGKIVLDDEQAKIIAQDLKRNRAADGFFDLNTCNRNEWIVSSLDPRWAVELLRSQMKQRLDRDGESGIEPYVYTGEEAARHVFRVAIGQESLVVGERQIARQLYQAMELARARGTSSRVLNGMGSVAGRLVRIALRGGCIENAAVGVHALAVSYIRERLQKKECSRVAVIGLGQIGRRVLGSLDDRRFESVCCNRTVAADQRDRIRPLDELSAVLSDVDVAIVCTGAMEPVVRREHLQSLPEDRPLLLVDIGIPEQVERTAIPGNVEITGLDDLVAFYHRSCGNPGRQSMDERADSLIQKALTEFKVYCSETALSGVLDTVQKHHRQIVGQEIPRLVAEQFDYLPENTRYRLEFDLKNIILSYTGEVFRTIKEASMRDEEEGECQDESWS